MAEFNVDLQAPQGAGAAPVAPVGESPNPFFALAGSVVEEFGKYAANQRKADAEAAKNAVVGDYAAKLSAIEDGLISGSITPEEANVRRRSTQSRFMASYGTYAKEFKEVFSAFKEGGAIGEALEAEQEEQNREREILNRAGQAGLVVPKGATQAVRDSVISAQLATDRFESELKRAKSIQEYRSTLSEEERKNAEREEARNTDVLLTDLGNKHLDAFGKIVEMGVRNSWEGRDIQDVMLNAQQYLTGVRQTVNIVARGDKQKADAFMKLFEEQFDFLKNAPNLSREETSNQLKQFVEKRALAMVMSDSEALNMAANLRLGFNIQNFDSNARRVVDRLVKFSGSPNSSGSMELAAGGAAMGTAVQTFNTVAGQQTDATGEQQKVNIANGILRSISLSTSVNGMDSTKFNAATDFLASEGFKALWNSGKISPQDVEGAERAYQKLYAHPVSLAIQQRLTQDTYTPRARYGLPQVTNTQGRPENPLLTQPRAQTPEARPYSDFVEYQMIGEALVARPKIVEGHQFDVQDSQRISEDLRSTTEYLNKLVTIGTTLTRSPTKQAFWEMNKHTILPDIYPDPAVVKEGKVYEMDGKKFKYKGGFPWKNPNQWEEVKDGSAE